MNGYFIGSVGHAEAFKRDANGNLTLAFTSRTLTDSGINISVSKDDIRGGEGAAIQFNFFHDANVEITLTDVLWKREYLTAQLGAQFDAGISGQFDYITETLTARSNLLFPTNRVQRLPVPCSDGGQFVVWYSKVGEDEWHAYSSSSTILAIPVSALDGTAYCVRYLAPETHAKTAEITSTIIPEELFLIITAPLFSGDACAASRGRLAGHITFEIPRFQLNGTQEFNLNMSQNQTMSLNGVALASPSESCDSSADKLLRIMEVNFNIAWYSDIVALAVDESCLQVGAVPVVFGITSNGDILRCPNQELIYRRTSTGEYTAMPANYTFDAGTYYLNINAGTHDDPTPFLNSDNEVTVDAPGMYSITSSVTNGEAASTNPTVISPGSSATLIYRFDGTSYSTPASVSVSGATQVSWVQDSTQQGTLVINNPTGNVMITVVGEPILPQLATPAILGIDGYDASVTVVENAESYRFYVDDVDIGTYPINL